VAAVPTFSVVYGAFATVPILLLWIYLGWVIVLLGAVIAAYAPSIAMRVVRLPERPGHRFALAISVLRLLAEARGNEVRGLAPDVRAGTLRVDPLQIAAVLGTLAALNWVGRLDEPGAQRHVLLIEPSAVSAEPLIDRLLLHDRQAAAAFRRETRLGELSVAALIASA